MPRRADAGTDRMVIGSRHVIIGGKETNLRIVFPNPSDSRDLGEPSQRVWVVPKSVLVC